jgi:hypothetical protein
VSCPLYPQESTLRPDDSAAAQLPESPQPQVASPVDPVKDQQTPATQNQPSPATTPPAQQSSSSQTTAQQSEAGKSQHDKAEEQLKEQEKQRTLGVVPAFNISYRPDAVSLTAGQKMKLAFLGRPGLLCRGTAGGGLSRGIG